jgi:hypothetical protein
LIADSPIAHYHCVSRVVDRRFVFGERERDVFRTIMRQVEALSGVRVLTWTILSNHFHLLLEVTAPPPERLSDDEILGRCRALYRRDRMDAIVLEFADARRRGGEALQRLRSNYLARMRDLSEFMKTLKQKFTSWFNRQHHRVGTLWESRFKALLVEGSRACLLKVAAYIDLNAVRAGLADDPKNYRWSGYAEAIAGNRAARRGLALALADLKPGADWRDVAPRYRNILFGIGGSACGAADLDAHRAGLKPGAVAKVLRDGGKLSLAQLLRCRIRYMADGLVIGSAGFVDSFFHSKREAFGERRKSGARRMKGGDWGGLRVARDLVVEPISSSVGDG